MLTFARVSSKTYRSRMKTPKGKEGLEAQSEFLELVVTG
jgi:hypothetical protein